MYFGNWTPAIFLPVHVARGIVLAFNQRESSDRESKKTKMFRWRVFVCVIDRTAYIYVFFIGELFFLDIDTRPGDFLEKCRKII